MKTFSSRALAAGLCTTVLAVSVATAQAPKGNPHQPVLRGHAAARAANVGHVLPLQAMQQERSESRLGAGRRLAPKGEPFVWHTAAFRGGPPSNDNCSTATTLTVGSTCSTVTGTAAGATASIAALTCNTFQGDADDDVWYKFVATATTQTITVVGSTSYDAVVDLRSGACNGTNIACADASVAGQQEQIIANGLTVGTQYYVRVYDYNTGEPATPTFTICVTSGAPPPPANDDCANATALTVHADGDCTTNATMGDNSTATQSVDGPTCDATTTGIFADVWYSFNSGSNADIALNFDAGTMGDLVVVLYDGCGGTELDCAVAPTFPYHYSVTPGTNYVLRVYSNTQYGNGGQFALCLSAASAPPVNDECTGATVQDLSVPGSVTVNGDNTGATDSEGVGVNTVWEAFTITSCANVSVSYCGTAPGFQGFTQLVIGCPTFTGVVDSTSTQDCGDGNLQVNFDGLAAGTYYYPVAEVDGVIEGPYTITFAATACAPAPANDLCSDVTPVALAAGSPVTFTGDNTGATSTGDVIAGGILDVGGDTTTVWHAFTTTECTNISVAYCGTATPPSNYWAVLATSCPADDDLIFFSNGNFSDCGDDNATIFFSSVPAGTYYLPVRGEPATAGPYSILVTATACPPPPANDDCVNATPLDVHLTCQPTQGDVFGATESMPAILCNGFQGDANDDVWYSFVATGINHTITVDAADTLDAVVELFSGDCVGMTSLDCADATLGGGVETIAATDLTPGSTYYVRVYDWYSGYPIASTFDICVTGDIETGIAERTAATFNVRPNPSNGNITVRYNAPNAYVSLDVLDMTGRVVYGMQRPLTKGQDIDLSLAGRLAEGNYVLRMTSTEGRSEQRIVVRY